MKPSVIATNILCLCALFLFAGCAGEIARPTIDYAVLIDETDTTLCIPDTTALIADMGFDTNMWQGVNFSLARILDVSYVSHSLLTLPAGPNRLAGNKYERKREVSIFESKLAGLLDSAWHEKPGKPRSSIYLPVSDELKRLANSSAERKVLVICSDMRENTNSVSFYYPRTAILLKNDPDKVKDELFTQAQLPNLAGIEIRIIYLPRNADDDASFRLASGFFRRFFEEHGAKVSVSANLTKQ